MSDDGLERATTHASDAGDGDVAKTAAETRLRDCGGPAALYAVTTQKISGTWVTFDEFVDPVIANDVAALLRSFGAAVRIELIERPIR